MARPSDSARRIVGLGFLPDEARHGFLIDIPKGSGSSEIICITEHRGNDLDHLGARTVDRPSPNDASLRVVIDRNRWLALAPAFWDEANRRLRANGLPVAKFIKNPAKPVPVHPSLGKELCILCWAVEDASPDDIPNALHNWEALAPEERWWLYTMTVATTGQAMQKGLGWRKALRAAIADNPFVKGEGLSPKARRELLGHSQLSLSL
ncbi:MAG: hypothetical protein AW10_03005 [Candidatus Accumulibacter appositus]|uniref:DUF3780 domain-containing protein n=1 Tax=Candidatus Accumulibacter appositus TaxID=1454003 RepID=A0A011NT73_9PROT|nr:DUF3780 domain-containing protein [Accumulibacter sp.]EXI78521.1 MAG: hypothetical protein AW10_03005 [Candidatus Accumulibacter appositus]HRF05937.1 DUF3780 domain-containing protein [Accumulibacter sp.]